MGNSGAATHACYSDTQEASLAYKVDSRQTNYRGELGFKKKGRREEEGRKKERRERERKKERTK